MRFRIDTPLATLALLLFSISAHAQFQYHYDHVSGGSTQMAAPGKSTVSVQEPELGDVLYLNSDDNGGFRLTKVSSTGSWITTWSYPGVFGQPEVEAKAMSLDTDGDHVIVVGERISPAVDERLFVMKIQISDGLVVWTQQIDDIGNWDLASFWDGVVIARYSSPQRSQVVFGNVFTEVAPDVFVRKLAGFSISEVDGSLIWSNIYAELNPALFAAIHTQPTDVRIRGHVAYVAAEIDNETSSRVGIFQINAFNGDFIEMNTYRFGANDAIYHPRIDAIDIGKNSGLALAFNDMNDSPVIALIGGGGNVVWARRIASADNSAGVLGNTLLPGQLDCFVGEADRAGIVSFDAATGILLDDHYFATETDIVSMDRSQDHRYLLSLEQRDIAELLGLGLGFIYNDDASVTNSFELIHTGDPGTPFQCDLQHSTLTEQVSLIRRRFAYVFDNWAETSALVITAVENTTLADAPCTP